ncbi:4'-phosphopantetheinyl transferase [Tamilnaduibacter salinus]|uniref:Enterobactin synthase component D n=1 Tax=Tamilnaduibacter salinus TaxID=1484056 RepID=A0A2A2I864_9GAMM|nr:4'-phosphopantetheinyl transferase superfamily protein [Tamilnaduibacter salinus]PAV27243.1 4'-phosphopantetheinyl transferase [Tamilnaduibacter salinus]
MPTLPECCGAFEDRWPFRQRLPGLSFVQTQTSPEHFHPDAPAQAALPEPPSILNAQPKRRTDFLAGRLCAREALTSLGGPVACPDQREDGAPAWPDGFTGSISHTDGLATAIAGLSEYWMGLGMDLEPMIGDERARRLAPRLLTPDERARFRNRLEQAPGALVTTVFSFKESLFKALHPVTGQRFYFQDAELMDTPNRDKTTLRLCTALGPSWPEGSTLEGHLTDCHDRCLTLVTVPA